MKFLIIIRYLKSVSSSPRSAYVCPCHAVDWSRLSPPSSTNEGRRKERATACLHQKPPPRRPALIWPNGREEVEQSGRGKREGRHAIYCLRPSDRATKWMSEGVSWEEQTKEREEKRMPGRRTDGKKEGKPRSPCSVTGQIGWRRR